MQRVPHKKFKNKFNYIIITPHH